MQIYPILTLARNGSKIQISLGKKTQLKELKDGCS